MTESKSNEILSESSAVTPPTVTPGLGFPVDRIETSPESTGWLGLQQNEESGNVSRGTSNK